MAQLYGCMRATFAEEGMSVGQMVLLRVLIHKGKATPKELAEALSVTTGNITGLLDKLEAAGLVTRTRSAEDRRVIHVELTAKARQRFRKVHRASVDMLSEAFEGWTEPEISHLHGLLERLSSNQRQTVAPPRRRARLRH
jgi:DNA-binding MarR family transcriptional regulator